MPFETRSQRSEQTVLSSIGSKRTDIFSRISQDYLQEAQLSQRDRATLRVIEYFAKSLKITQGHSK